MKRSRRLSVQLSVWFVAIALVPLAVVTVWTYLAAERALRSQVTTGLYAIARRQANEIATYVREREQNVATLSRMPGTIDALEELGRAFAGDGQGPALDTLDRQYRPFLSYYQEAFGYDDLLLALRDGSVVFSARRRQAVGTNLRADPHRTTGRLAGGQGRAGRRGPDLDPVLDRPQPGEEVGEALEARQKFR